jgi:predicted ribonuclease YlaK
MRTPRGNLCSSALPLCVLKELDTKRHHRLAENAQRLGGLVRHLRLTLEDGPSDNKDLPIYRLLSSMPSVQSLTIAHRQQDVARHTPLQHVVEKFVHLEEIIIKEKDYNPRRTHVSAPRVAIAETFFHTFPCSALIGA